MPLPLPGKGKGASAWASAPSLSSRLPRSGRGYDREATDALLVELAAREAELELQGDELSRADESTLYHHYELNYTPPDTESGRRLARR